MENEAKEKEPNRETLLRWWFVSDIWPGGGKVEEQHTIYTRGGNSREFDKSENSPFTPLIEASCTTLTFLALWSSFWHFCISMSSRSLSFEGGASRLDDNLQQPTIRQGTNLKQFILFLLFCNRMMRLSWTSTCTRATLKKYKQTQRSQFYCFEKSTMKTAKYLENISLSDWGGCYSGFRVQVKHCTSLICKQWHLTSNSTK